MQIYQEQFSPEKNNCFHIGHNILIEKEFNWKWFLKNTLINIFQCFENNEVFDILQSLITERSMANMKKRK